ncbi:uncharacterized protein MELLADRAFT_100986 [Melampsora larici-populina 98AG31]|uniref:Uncharacterized protein n=1 Tax=Melampsora larici-populina (strain 98AG31 / pathotype 3-4-7) TaxID=747676 RepID=F4R383_MELLP|nr:uncharacterized protein MELLADRAFT_100986 [Melampsora larici-populina 98AG31]EGG12583.1 hypothetical protein MELLADRAFT_100986 [Melampsora larici-populina 98AG31]
MSSASTLNNILNPTVIKLQTEDSEQLFKQFGRSISTLYNHGIARNRITTNGPKVALGKRKRGDMFAIGMRAGYWKGVFGDCGGVVEMVWATDVEHQTTESTTHGAKGDRVNP